MIFVTVGTQPNGFLRCLIEVENLIDKYNITEEIVAQIGHTNFVTTKFKTLPFTGENEFREYIKNASVVITHAGSGAIFNSIKAGKKIIAMARLHEFNEMADNHQTELIKKLAGDGYIIDGTYSLVDAWTKLEGFVPRENDFTNIIISSLDQYITKVFDQD
ncbi:MAG: glycosyl transferase family 28 [Paludibacteraceae bacterium]|nr:glycosyl transferase family 28 [Paludibacteraceae bacterium]